MAHFLVQDGQLVAAPAVESAEGESSSAVVPEDVCTCERAPDDPGVLSIKNNRKGQEKRASYAIEMKAQVILEAFKSGMTQEKVSWMLVSPR